MAEEGLCLLLGLVVAVWLLSSYAGLRRNMRVRVRLLQAERECERLDGEVQALERQLRAEQAVVERFSRPDRAVQAGRRRGAAQPGGATHARCGLPHRLRCPDLGWEAFPLISDDAKARECVRIIAGWKPLPAKEQQPG